MLVNSILSVEDNRILQDIHCMMLAPIANHVESAMSGQEALDKLSRSRYDLILLDIQMPKMTGLEVAKLIRERGIDTPIIAVTGADTPKDRADCLAAGIEGYAPKPLDEQDLLIEIKRLLS